MPGTSQETSEYNVEQERAAASGFAFLIGSIVLTVGVMVASLVIAANHIPR